jgi:flagellar protein FlbD
MIAVTRLDGGPMVINVDLIELIEPTPDTLISMSNGDKLYVRESPAEVIELVVRLKRAVLAGGGAARADREVASKDEPCQ